MLTNDAANEIGSKLMPYRFTSEGKDYIRSIILTLNPMDQEEVLMRWPALVPFCLEKKTWSKKDDDKPIIVGDTSRKFTPKILPKDDKDTDTDAEYMNEDVDNVLNDVYVSKDDIYVDNNTQDEEPDDSIGGLLDGLLE